VAIVLGVGRSARGAVDQLLDGSVARNGSQWLVVIEGRGVSQREFLNVGIVQGIDPLATIGTELLILKVGPAITAGLLRQETSFLVGGIVPRA
jgi:hypothetical protein